MSIAKKCDICGKLYDPYSIPINSDDGDLDVNGLAIVHINEEGEYGAPDEACDCCEDCLRQILDLMDHLEYEGKRNRKEKKL